MSRRLVEIEGRAYEVRWNVRDLKDGGTLIGSAAVLRDGELVAALEEPADLWARRHLAREEGITMLYPLSDTLPERPVGTCSTAHYPAAIEAVKLALKGGGDAC